MLLRRRTKLRNIASHALNRTWKWRLQTAIISPRVVMWRCTVRKKVVGDYSKVKNLLKAAACLLAPLPGLSGLFRSRAQAIVDSTCLAARLIAIGGLLWTQSTTGYEIRIDGVHCAASVHVLAREAPLSEILRQLAKSLGFEVRYEASFDPDINIDSTKPASEVIARIGQSVNLSIVEYRNAGCSNAWHVTKVVVLPTSERDNSTRLNSEAQTPAFGTPEQIRKSQEVVDAFLAETHGGSRHGP